MVEKGGGRLLPPDFKGGGIFEDGLASMGLGQSSIPSIAAGGILDLPDS